jgi:hypothetical protein
LHGGEARNFFSFPAPIHRAAQMAETDTRQIFSAETDLKFSKHVYAKNTSVWRILNLILPPSRKRCRTGYFAKHPLGKSRHDAKSTRSSPSASLFLMRSARTPLLPPARSARTLPLSSPALLPSSAAVELASVFAGSLSRSPALPLSAF